MQDLEPHPFLYGLAKLAFMQLSQEQPELRAAFDRDAWVQRVAEILAVNIASGRYQVACSFQTADADGDASLLNYARQILNEVICEGERIEALHRGESAAWQTVCSRLERLAYFWLNPRGREAWAAWEARDAAGRTCADIWAWLQEHPYPFDVPFDRWSAAVLKRRLYSLARQRQREKRRIAFSLDMSCRELADKELHAYRLADDSLDEWLAQAANRQLLVEAIGRLDTRQALVVRLWYFDQWPADEIAAHLATSVPNVYLLRFRAIQKLRQILVTDARFDSGKIR